MANANASKPTAPAVATKAPVATTTPNAAAAAMALPQGSVAVAPPIGSRGAALLHCPNPTATYGVRVANPANANATLVLPFTLPPQAAKLHPQGCYVVVRPQVGWLGQDGVNPQAVRWHICRAPWQGLAVVAHPGSMASNPNVAYVVRPLAGCTIAGHLGAQQPCPTA